MPGGHLIIGEGDADPDVEIDTSKFYLNKAKIILHGSQNDPEIEIGPGMRSVNKAIINKGNFSIYGDGNYKKNSVLTKSTNINDTTIEVFHSNSNLNWKVGDEIVISSSKTQSDEFEKRTIISINNKTIELDQPLEYVHFGEEKELSLIHI